MTFNGWLQIAIFCVLIVLLTKPFGGYMTRVFAGERTSLSPVLRPVERGIYRLCGVDEREEQHWLTYASRCCCSASPASSSCTRCSACRTCCRSTRRARSRSTPDLAFNTAVSFATNTNWQSYVPETTMSYLVADGRAHGAQLRLGGHRHRARHRADPRLRPALGADASATSGSI